MRRAIPVLLALLAVVPAEAESARALKDVRGVVEAVTSEARVDSTHWTVVAVRTTEGEVFRVGLASEEVLDSEAFEIVVGDPVRVRFFTDGEPHEAQRIRNETTGRVLRLRCLHGDPLWRDRGGPGRGGGPGRRGR
jgi:hypothetical protein